MMTTKTRRTQEDALCIDYLPGRTGEAASTPLESSVDVLADLRRQLAFVEAKMAGGERPWLAVQVECLRSKIAMWETL